MSIALAAKLADIYASLSKRDGKWEICEDRSVHPSKKVATELGEISRELSEAASEFQREFPYNRDVVDRLSTSSRELSRLHGKVANMAANETNYGSGWGDTLDPDIRNVRDALLFALSTK